MRVIKRDGTIQKWSLEKIEHAILKAFNKVQPGEIPDLKTVLHLISFGVETHNKENKDISVEFIQDAVIDILRSTGFDKVAKQYEEYRTKRDAIRAERLTPDPSAITDYVVTSKYSSWVKDEKRRESWNEITTRCMKMHIRKFPEIEKEIREAFVPVFERKVLPSMRSLQFGGKGIEQHNVRIYNCSWSLANRVRVFQEIFYNLLCGTGCGLSVQFKHIDQLPKIKQVNKDQVNHFTVEDDIEGWSDSVGELIKSYMITGDYVEFNYSKIRSKGSILSTSGGRAPGHLPLKALHDQLRNQLDSCAFRKLRPIEVADIICKIAEAVLSGGIRRSSLIILFSPEDSEMAHSKIPGNFEWEGKNYWRRMMNISAACLKGKTKKSIVKRLISLARDFGDPGIYWLVHPDCGCNPCGEIGMYPKLSDSSNTISTEVLPADGDLSKFLYEEKLTLEKPYVVSPLEGKRWLKDASHKYSYLLNYKNAQISDDSAIEEYGHDTGWQFCNLCEVNIAECKTEVDFYKACVTAAFIGTLQAAYTDMPYLGPVTEKIVKREALLGVSLTGMADNPEIAFDSDILRNGAKACKVVNDELSKKIRINPAARITTIKPSGTASLVLGCVGSGIHPHHARRYFRRVTETTTNPIAQYFKQHNPHMVEVKPDGNLCLTFCVKAPDNAVTVKELKATDFMNQIFDVYESWILPGTVTERCVINKLTHNVSCTVVVSENEWEDVIEKLWNNQNSIGAMSFLPRMGDKGIPFMPREEVVTPADEAKWDYLIENYRKVDYTKLVEELDNTTRQAEAACVGGQCDI